MLSDGNLTVCINLNKSFFDLHVNGLQVEFAQISSALVTGMEKEWLNPVVDKEYTMSEIQQAHKDLIKPHGASGKLVLKII